MASPQWRAELFNDALGGVSSAVAPEMLGPQQLAWGVNVINRGAKPGTRPSFKRLLTLPSGLCQGAAYFGVQGGMGVASIEGILYRLRINPRDATYERINLEKSLGDGSGTTADINSAVIKKVYMQQTVETLVIQDGQSEAILYNGSTVRRADRETEVPIGRQMAYGNGRLWVAVGGKGLVAGDIRTNQAESELKFTETNYLSGGGTFYFPRGITGLGFIATTGTSDYGALMVFGGDYADSLRADITYRDLWAQTPGFITNVLRHTGCASHWSLTSINQDLYWRDSSGGIRSIRSSLADESGAGNSPISREVSRLTDYDSPQLLDFCSGVSFDNRLLMTSSPRLNAVGGRSWGDLISLDFAPISTMQGKSSPAYDGQWSGLLITHMFQGIFDGRNRCFAITHDAAGSNSLFEINIEGRGGIDDTTVSCSDGSGLAIPSKIQAAVEYGARSFGNTAIRKRLERCDVYLTDIEADFNLKVYWRGDNQWKWQLWDEGVTVCAKVTQPETTTPFVWKNLRSQGRPQIKTFTIPSEINGLTNYSLATGFEFQIRLVWTGKGRIDKTILYASFLDDGDYALRELVDETCLEDDSSGNQLNYFVPTDACPQLEIIDEPEDVTVSSGSGTTFEFERFDGPFIYPALAFGSGFYRRLSVTGINGVRSEYYGGTPWSTECCTLACPPLTPTTDGKAVTQHNFSGYSELDISGGFYTGTGLTDLITSRGPPQLSYFGSQNPAPPSLTISAYTKAGLFQAMADNGMPFLAKYYEKSPTALVATGGTLTTTIQERYWTPTLRGPNENGFFGGNFGGQIWCLGQDARFVYEQPIPVNYSGLTPNVFGNDAKTQHLTTTGTENTYDGTTSQFRVRGVAAPGKQFYTASAVYRVIPDDGSAEYVFNQRTKVPVEAEGGPFTAVVEFPKIFDAVVVFLSGRVSAEEVVEDGFDLLADFTEIDNIDPVSDWDKPMTFTLSVPNSWVADNFESMTAGVVYTLPGGFGWVDQGTFFSADPTIATDQFDAYPVTSYDYNTGEITNVLDSLYGGSGWVSFGTFFNDDYPRAEDAFNRIRRFGYASIYETYSIFKEANQVVTIPSNAAYNLTDFTIQMWINFDLSKLSDPASGFNAIIPRVPQVVFDSTNNGATDGIKFRMTPLDSNQGTQLGECYLTLRAGGVSTDFNCDLGYFINRQKTYDTFIGISITREGNVFKSYAGFTQTNLDLIRQQTTANSNAISSSSTLVVGGSGLGRFWGKLAEFRIWNYARTLQEMRLDNVTTLTGSETGIVGLFPFNIPSTTTIIDLSPTANNGSRGTANATAGDGTVEMFEYLGYNNGGTSESDLLGLVFNNRWSISGFDPVYGNIEGRFTTVDYLIASDNFEEETSGATITTLPYGSGWEDTGVLTTLT